MTVPLAVVFGGLGALALAASWGVATVVADLPPTARVVVRALLFGLA